MDAKKICIYPLLVYANEDKTEGKYSVISCKNI